MQAKELIKQRNRVYDNEYHNPNLYQKIENIIFEILEDKTDLDLNKIEKKIMQIEEFRRWEDSTLPYLVTILKKHELVDEFIFRFKKLLIRNLYLGYFSDFDKEI